MYIIYIIELRHQMVRYQQDIHNKSQELLTNYQIQLQQMEVEYQLKLNNEITKHKLIINEYEDKELLLRKLELDFNKEKKKMTLMIENAIIQLNNSQQGIIMIKDM